MKGWSKTEFLERLKAVGIKRYHDKHPFHLRMHRGELSRDELKSWILNRFYYQKNLPVKDALILAKLPTREERRIWLQRIVDHDGRSGSDGGIEAWLKLGEAAGLSARAMLAEKDVAAGVRFAVDSYVNFCRLQPWLMAVASSLTELFAPDLVKHRIAVIERHYQWVPSEGLDYFRNRLTQAPRDADHALELVLTNANSPSEQRDAVGALHFKCDVLWAMLDAIDCNVEQHERFN